MNHDDDLPEDDGFEAVAVEHEGRPLVSAAFCPGCNAIKPLDQFRRYLTRAEAKHRGYSGERLVQIETEKCAACRPRRRRNPNAFSTPELKKKAERGEINPTMVSMIEKARVKEARSNQTAAVKRRWDAATEKKWATLIADINHELHAVRQQRRYARTKLHTHDKTTLYAQGYCELLTKLRADLKLAMRRGSKKPQHERWQDYFTAYERNIVAALWEDIPFAIRSAGLRPPHMFALDRTSPVTVPLPDRMGENERLGIPPTDASEKEPDTFSWDDL